ncbi:MAG: hypothetical protein LC112_11090 [Flavobacteriales bacterium]|nr:hypothetical protein [Flavobacteriales bacterium]
MIKANELRIGNLVSRLDLGDHSLRVESVLELRKDKVLTTGPISVICLYSETKPIPLTEEWLFKFGFENKILSSEFSMNDFPFIIYNNEIWTDRDNDDDVICKVDFVHELQNFYFAVKRKELELKLN